MKFASIALQSVSRGAVLAGAYSGSSRRQAFPRGFHVIMRVSGRKAPALVLRRAQLKYMRGGVDLLFVADEAEAVIRVNGGL